MNLFGFEVKRNNGKYVRREECHRAQDEIKGIVNQRIDDLKEFINIRIDDVKDTINGK